MSSTTITRIGIVEDNNSLRKTLIALVDATPGFQCVCASASAEDALVDIPKHKPDVVLMDIHLPGESGIACTARLTAQMEKRTAYSARRRGGWKGMGANCNSPRTLCQSAAGRNWRWPQDGQAAS